MEMNVDAVIESGSFGLWESVWHYFSKVDFALSAFGFVLLAMASSVFITIMGYSFAYEATRKVRYSLDNPGTADRAGQTGGALFIFILLASFILNTLQYRNDPDSEMVKEWMKRDVTPYVLSLPEQKIPLLGAENAAQGTGGLRPYLQDEKAPQSVVPMTLTYNDDHGEKVTIQALAVVKHDLPAGAEPYMLCRKTEWDLGHGFDRGVYNPVVHVAKAG